MNDLTIVCISKIEAYATLFLHEMQGLASQLDCSFVIGADGLSAERRAYAQFPYATSIVAVESKGYLESVHDMVIDRVQTPYVLRLDDDEKASPAMVDWLYDRAYRADDHWKFPRANLWTLTTFINSPHLWPDTQTRLSVKTKAGGRGVIHAGSPYGGGRPAPVAIEHHKFIVKTYEERLRIAERYDTISKGCGTGGMIPFNLPEDFYKELPLDAWKDGAVG
jgi:hypothetical protein